MKKNIFKKSISALTAIAVCTSMASFPVFAEEKIISDEESFASSYEGDAQTVAQYLINNNYSVEKATSIMERYLKGEEQEKKDIDYYSKEFYSYTPHYVVSIFVDPEETVEDLNLYFEANNYKTRISDDVNCKTCFSYASTPIAEISLDYLSSNKWRYKIGISKLENINKTEAQPLAIFPIYKGTGTPNEFELYKSINLKYDTLNSNGLFAFETFALGDTNHDGQVTESDLALLLKIQAGLDTFKQDYKDGSNHYSGVTNEVASDVNFDGTIDLKDVELINDYLDGTYNLGDPVPEQTEEEKFVSSYEGDTQTVAQYLLDNGCSLEEAKEMMDIYLKGKEQLDSMGKGDSGSSVDIDYYSATCIAPTPHYAAIISIDPTRQQENITFTFNGLIRNALEPNEGSYKICSQYLSSLSGVNESLEFLTTDKWLYTLSVSNIDSVDVVEAAPMFLVPIVKGQICNTEERLYRSFDFNYEVELGNGFYTYETFALGDVNHDGQVNEADTMMLMNVLSGSDTFKHIYKDSSNHYSGVTNKLASDVNFDGTVDLKDVELIKAYLDGTYNLGDPVPEQKEPEKDTTLYGDISGDGAINLADVIYINKAIAGSYIIPESLKPSADVCKDGEINLDDTLVLLKYLINLVKLPVIPE